MKIRRYNKRGAKWVSNIDDGPATISPRGKTFQQFARELTSCIEVKGKVSFILVCTLCFVRTGQECSRASVCRSRGSYSLDPSPSNSSDSTKPHNLNLPLALIYQLSAMKSAHNFPNELHKWGIIESNYALNPCPYAPHLYPYTRNTFGIVIPACDTQYAW